MFCSTKSDGAAACFFNESNLNIDMAKTRAVPLKLLTLPLLEWMAADWEMSCKIHSQKLILSNDLTARVSYNGFLARNGCKSSFQTLY